MFYYYYCCGVNCLGVAGTMKGVDGALCEKPSLTWSGNCKNTQNCDKQCKEWEGAKHGACHKRGNWKCFCYRDCWFRFHAPPSYIFRVPLDAELINNKNGVSFVVICMHVYQSIQHSSIKNIYYFCSERSLVLFIQLKSGPIHGFR